MKTQQPGHEVSSTANNTALLWIACVLLSLYAQPLVGGDEKATVLFKETFAADGTSDVTWKGLKNWVKVDDKRNGAQEQQSLCAKKEGYAPLTRRLADPINPRVERSILRLTAHVRTEIAGKNDDSRFELRLLTDDARYWYGAGIICKAVSLQFQAPAKEQTVPSAWVAHGIAGDEMYHAYTLELRPDGHVALYADGDLLNERQLPIPDFDIFKVELVRVESENGGGQWYLDNVTLSSAPPSK